MLPMAANLTLEDIEMIRTQTQSLDDDAKTKLMFVKVRAQICNGDGVVVLGKTHQWHYKDVSVCRSFWCHINCIGHAFLEKIVKWIKAGLYDSWVVNVICKDHISRLSRLLSFDSFVSDKSFFQITH